MAPRALFVCVHNSGRSQMAAALLEHHAMGKVRVRSTGSVPGDAINPTAVAAPAKWGIDLTGSSPSALVTDDVEASDVVVTKGCSDTCPVSPGERSLDWDLPDPAGQELDVVRPLRDDIDRRVRVLLVEPLD